MTLKGFGFMGIGIWGLIFFAWGTALAETSYSLSAGVKETYNRISAVENVKRGIEFIKSDHAHTIAEQKQICEIPAPPFKEKAPGSSWRHTWIRFLQRGRMST
jgi:hypothetical protein